jgi:hypothetical protein
MWQLQCLCCHPRGLTCLRLSGCLYMRQTEPRGLQSCPCTACTPLIMDDIVSQPSVEGLRASVTGCRSTYQRSAFEQHSMHLANMQSLPPLTRVTMVNKPHALSTAGASCPCALIRCCTFRRFTSTITVLSGWLVVDESQYAPGQHPEKCNSAFICTVRPLDMCLKCKPGAVVASAFLANWQATCADLGLAQQHNQLQKALLTPWERFPRSEEFPKDAALGKHQGGGSACHGLRSSRCGPCGGRSSRCTAGPCQCQSGMHLAAHGGCILWGYGERFFR